MITFATANVENTLVGAAVKTAVDAAAPADVIAFQEVETQAHINAVNALSGMKTFWPGGHGVNPRNATPICYNQDEFTFKYGRCTLAIPGIAKVSPSRYTVWAVFERGALKTQSAQKWAFLSIHTVSGVDNHNQEYRGWRMRTRRFMQQLHFLQIKRRIKVLKKNHPGIKIVLGGDLNNHTKLGTGVLGLNTHYADAPTHGGPHGSYYDVVATDQNVVSMTRRTSTTSDHDVLMATIAE